MTHDEIDRILSQEEELLPSAGFTASVMDAVRREAALPAPIPFPWTAAHTKQPTAAGRPSWRSSPSNVSTWLMRALRRAPSTPSHPATSIAGRIVPWLMRPTPMRPTKVE